MPSQLPLKPFLLALTVVATIAGGAASQASASIADRAADPVVLTGADVPALEGVFATDVVAFGFDGDWYQVPVQVDERKMINPRTLYPFPDTGYVQTRSPFQIEVYADPETLTGEDPDPALDDDDEIAFMTYDTGVKADSVPDPFGVVSGSGVTVKVTDPADGDSSWIYLFESDGSIDPSAESEYVSYDFSLDSLADGGSLIDDYDFADGPNPEDSSVVTPYYETHSSDRWVDDGLSITDEIEDPIDILDRDKVLFAPGNCVRSEDTFIQDEGSFIANINGPIRGIRSYVGANSGPYTQREHIYYEQREDVRTYLRVHQIEGAMWFFDYAPEAAGMTYRNQLNPAGVTIDGRPDTSLASGLPASFASGGPVWEQVTGPQGTMDVINSVATDISGLRYESYYLDDSTPDGGSQTQCTGDAFAYGSSGIRVSSALPNTDPKDAPAKSFTSTRSMYFSAPGGTAATAAAHARQADAPLTTTSTVLVPGKGGGASGAVLRLKVKPGSRRADRGKSARFKLVLKNTGSAAAVHLKICVALPRKLSGGGCFTKADLGAGKGRTYGLRLRVRRSARPGATYPAKVTVRALDTKPVRHKLKIRVPVR